jgi:chromosome segregation and condensation protein ScpB
MDVVRKVEAVLYASESPMSAGDISSVIGEPREEVIKAIKKLARDYSARETCLAVARSGIRYKLQLRNEYSDIVAPVSRMEIDQVQVKILGFVAANPGALRGQIIQKYGERSRPLIHDLVKRKLLSEKRYRNTEAFDVTREFYRYFNIDRGELVSRIRKTEGEENAQ